MKAHRIPGVTTLPLGLVVAVTVLAPDLR
jgi:hypothetical protein